MACENKIQSTERSGSLIYRAAVSQTPPPASSIGSSASVIAPKPRSIVAAAFEKPCPAIPALAPEAAEPPAILMPPPAVPVSPFRNTRRWIRGVVIPLLAVLLPAWVFAQETPFFTSDFSGYVKSLNFFTRTTGLTPEAQDSPLALAESRESVFSTLERLRLKVRSTFNFNERHRLKAKVDYDHQPYFGSFVATGDFRIARNLSENRQFLDLSQTLVEDNDAFYEHRLYRASLEYENDYFSLEVGRQQIPWGAGHFFTPTDIFNPFSPTQIELEERDGVDAVNLMTKQYHGYELQLIYTPRGKELHPYRYMGRLSRDIKGYEVGLLGGRVLRDYVYGFDLQGNIKNSAVRGEFLFREADEEKDFIKFTVNADYNFPHNIYGLLEYHFNGQGRRNRNAYQLDRFLRGDIQQMAKNYLAAMVGHNLTPLLRFENRTIFNMDDASFFVRPEFRYEWHSNLLLTLASQLYLGGPGEEYGRAENLYIGEMNYSF